MTLPNHDQFIQAILDRREVRLTWPSKEDNGVSQIRRCAPMDFGPSRTAHDKTPRYQFWDFESDSGRPHPLLLLATQITKVELLESTFDPAAFVTWDLEKSPWHVPRTTWGDYN